MHCSTLVLLALCCLGVGLATAAATPGSAAPAAPANNLYLELKTFLRQVPKKQIQHLARAYLLNDVPFQAVIRELNSLASYRLRQQLLNQPELRSFLQWLSQQLILSGGSLKVFDTLELEIKLFNKYPHWAVSTEGVAGFENEFNFLYPAAALRELLETNAQQSAIFGEFWRRVVALKPAYERFIATPQAVAFSGRLRKLGVNVEAADQLVRYQLGWSNASIPSYDYNDYLGLNNAENY
ncbi:CG13905 [Drosophila busckii]|uniref:CG13905 n=1 Tax=Drosophila busckii TaxID=30019 RepID=A0A0M4EK22_DROBS|nr:CG13905 [Drosophila busckii]